MSPNDPLSEALAGLDALLAAGLAALAKAATSEEVEAARVEFLGQKHGRVKTAQERLKSLEPSSRKSYGQRFNAVKSDLEAALEAARGRVERQDGEDGRERIDVTLPGLRPRLGHRHPLTQTAEELIDLFGRFGFDVARGPEVEDVRHNFDALNIPASHPARDPLDNFYLAVGGRVAGAVPTSGDDASERSRERERADSPAPGAPPLPYGRGSANAGEPDPLGGPIMLRSQTSTVQIRVMEAQPPPVRVIAIGRVYRPDTVDATHSFMFHQVEGLMVDRGVTMADLKTVLRLFAQAYLGRDVKIRFRPSFFPFTEPSVEVDMLWHGGVRWVEMGGAGMVDPNVLRAVGYDPEEVTGFAFGLGIERLCMRRHGIDDIRLLYQNDVRFLRQF